MSREIKFRAWIKSYECMIELKPTIGKYDFEDGFVVSFVVDGYEEFGAHERFDVKNDDIVLMQFTGLTDNNGKEIYEGDILKYELPDPDYEDTPKQTYTEYIEEVVFEDGQFTVEVMPVYAAKDMSEVIGNIYQNPEMLNKGI